MSDAPEITSTTLTLSVGATISVNGNVQSYGDWIRPSCSYAISWGGLPTEDQLRIATKFIQQEVLAPAIEDTIVQVSDRLQQSRRG